MLGGPKPGIAYQILGAVADAIIEVDVIIQNLSKDGKTDFSFTVNCSDYARTIEVFKEKGSAPVGRAVVGAKICKVSIVGIGIGIGIGIGMRSDVGVAAKMFHVLS